MTLIGDPQHSTELPEKGAVLPEAPGGDGEILRKDKGTSPNPKEDNGIKAPYEEYHRTPYGDGKN